MIASIFKCIELEQKIVAFFSSKISIFYKISTIIIPFNRAKFQFSESVLHITMIFNGIMSNQSQNPCLT